MLIKSHKKRSKITYILIQSVYCFGSLWRLTLVDLDEICISNTNRQLSVLRDWIIALFPAMMSHEIEHRCQAHPFRYGWSCQGHLLQSSPVQPCCHEAARSMWWPRGWGRFPAGQGIESKTVEFECRLISPHCNIETVLRTQCGAVVQFSTQLYHGWMDCKGKERHPEARLLCWRDRVRHIGLQAIWRATPGCFHREWEGGNTARHAPLHETEMLTEVVVDAIDGVANKCRLIYACPRPWS